MSEQTPTTTHPSIVGIAIAILVVASVAGFFVVRQTLGRPLAELEQRTVPVAQDYVMAELGSPSTQFGRELKEQTGEYIRSRAVDIATARGESTGVAVKLRIQGKKGEASALIVIDLSGDQKRVTEAIVVP